MRPVNYFASAEVRPVCTQMVVKWWRLLWRWRVAHSTSSTDRLHGALTTRERTDSKRELFPPISTTRRTLWSTLLVRLRTHSTPRHGVLISSSTEDRCHLTGELSIVVWADMTKCRLASARARISVVI